MSPGQPWELFSGVPMMASALSGTVTLLFTDIEGSTSLLERLRERYAEVLDGQRELLRDCFDRWSGHEVDTQGDSFFAAFTTPKDALQCAIDAQRQLLARAWPDGVTVRVRMGIHTGDPIAAGTGYIGLDVHRAARIGAAAHGGQVLLSDRSRAAVGDDLEGEVSFMSLGVQRFKGLSEPIEILQLLAPGLTEAFGPIQTAPVEEEPPAPGAAPYKGLLRFDERDGAMFFGRERVTRQILEQIAQQSVLAVVGASGSGKSSIVRAGVLPALKAHTEEVWKTYVLTPTGDPLGGLARLASASRSTHPLEALRRRARRADRILLVIDQFEELFTLCHDEAARRQFVDVLLAAPTHEIAPRIAVLITLRADFYARLAPYPALRDAVARHQVFVGPMDADELRQAIEKPAERGGWHLAPGLVDLLMRDIGREPGSLPLLSHALLETWRRRRGKTLALKGYFEAGEVRGAIARTADRVYGRFTDDERMMARLIMLRLTELGEEAPTRRRAELAELVPAGTTAERSEMVLRRLVDARLVTVDEGTAEVAHEALIREWPQLRDWLEADREGLRTHRHLTDAAREWLTLGRDESVLYRGARLATATEWAAPNTGTLNEFEEAFLAASTDFALREETERETQRQRELETAQRAADAERRRAEEQATSARRLRRRAVALGITGALAVMAAAAAVVLGWQAQAAATRAQARELASAAEANLNVDPERSLLLALRAVELGSGDSAEPLPEAVEALHGAVQASRIVASYNGHAGQVVGAAVSPDGSRSATLGVDGTVRVWDGAGREQYQLRVTPPPPDQTTTITFSVDGRLLFVPDGADVVAWEPAVGVASRLPPPAGSVASDAQVTSIVVSDDGSALARGAMDGTVAVYELPGGTLQRSLTIADAQPVLSVSISSDAKVLAAGGWGSPTAQVYDLTTGEPISSIDHGDILGAVALSGDGQFLVTGGWDAITRVWMAASGDALYSLFTHRSLINGLDIDDGGRLATASADGNVRLVDLATGRELVVIPAHASAVFAARFSATGDRLITSSGDQTGRLWDVSPQAGRELANLPMLDRVWSVAFSPNGSLIATGSVFNGQVQFWDAETGQLTASSPPDLAGVEHLSFVGDDLYAVQGGEIVRYDFQARRLDAWRAAEGTMTMAVSPDGTWLAVGRTNGALVYERATRTQVLDIGGFDGDVRSLAFSPDGALLGIAGQDGHALLVERATGAVRAVLDDHEGAVQRLVFSPDGDIVVTGSNDATARVWRASDGEPLHVLADHVSPVYGLDFSPDGSTLATGSIDSTIKLWSTADFGTRPLTLRGHSAAVYVVDFSLDGRRIVSGSRDRTARIFAVNVNDLVAIAETRVTRPLSPAECQQYLHLPTCPP